MYSLDERVKTDFRITKRVLRHLGDHAIALGMSKSGYVCMAICNQLISFAPLLKGVKKRQLMLDDVEEFFQKALSVSRRAP